MANPFQDLSQLYNPADWQSLIGGENYDPFWYNAKTGESTNLQPGGDLWLAQHSPLYGGDGNNSEILDYLGLRLNPYSGTVDYGNGIKSQYTRAPTLVFNQDTGQAYVQNPDGSTRAATQNDQSLPRLEVSPNRGNAGHGSWFDQQGSELIGDALFGGLGYASGGVGTAIVAPFMDNSAESQRNMRAGALGGIASSIFGGGGTSASNTPADAGGSGSTLGGSEGSNTLVGSGGSTDNYFGDYITDPNTGDVTLSGSGSDPYGTGVDQFGNPTGQYGDSSTAPIDDFSTGGTNQGVFSSPSQTDGSWIDWQKVAEKIGIPAAQKIYQAITGGGSSSGTGQGKPTFGQSILGQFGNDPLGSAASALPAIGAYFLAQNQRKDIQGTIDQMSSLNSIISGNASPFMTAITNPYDMQTGTGRAALMQDQGLRGIRGSSFGDQSLDSYDYTRGVGRADLASKALLASAGLQQTGLDSILKGKVANNLASNSLIGAGLGASGKLFQPEQDPFGFLKTLFGAPTNG